MSPFLDWFPFRCSAAVIQFHQTFTPVSVDKLTDYEAWSLVSNRRVPLSSPLLLACLGTYVDGRGLPGFIFVLKRFTLLGIGWDTCMVSHTPSRERGHQSPLRTSCPLCKPSFSFSGEPALLTERFGSQN